MPPSDLPTGTVGSDADPSTHPGPRSEDRAADGEATARADLRDRIAELERENAALRARIDQQRQTRHDLIDRYERMLHERTRERPRRRDVEVPPGDGLLLRIARRLRLR